LIGGLTPDSEIRYQFSDGTPESLTPFTLPRMIDDLTRPLMTKSIENGNNEYQAMDIILEKAPFEAAIMELTSNIV